ncbi:class I SAM-dependent methyltransferase [Mangrovicella endophytica]|uniref:class I SAM-dependent methyltransferase n=1 Tax=Mangrovicella endophytica TaxID=2066697 RepID=UPI000C9E9E7B|nr:class I SAM-dependent methyltransferase [Mangrovicella endophytica]
MTLRDDDLRVRRMEEEILDHLPENDPRAIASRSDLRRLNLLMGQAATMAGLLRRHVPEPPRRILEIGSGDGCFMARVAKSLAKTWPSVHLTLLDRQSCVSPACAEQIGAAGWSVDIVTADIFDWLRDAPDDRFDAICTNLFLHHFSDDTLRELLARLAQHAPVFVATEPLRAAFPHLASRLLRVIGANDVTRNDAPVSVRAGFRNRELSALWPQDALTHERRRGLFTHAFAAVARRPAPGR